MTPRFKIVGISRNVFNTYDVTLHLNRPATDDEMSWLHECSEVLGAHFDQLSREKRLMLGFDLASGPDESRLVFRSDQGVQSIATCPKCSSVDVQVIQTTKPHVHKLIAIKCNGCGYNDPRPEKWLRSGA